MKLDREFDATRRVLTLDIENTPLTTYQWSLRSEGYTSHKMMKEPGRVLCVAGKWLDRPKVVLAAEWKSGGHDKMVETVWDWVDTADIIIGWNSIQHDMKHLMREFRDAGLPPPRPWKDVDLIKTMRSRFAYPSNSLDYIAQASGIGAKIAHAGFALWQGAMAGDKTSCRLMGEYCCGDVTLTEAVYLDLLPWIQSHPPVKVSADGEMLCNRCESADLDRVGSALAVVHSFALYRCGSCTGLSRAGHVRKVTNTRAC